MAAPNALAITLRKLHVPGKPLILTNVYDAVSARAIAGLPGTQALATASYAVALAAGVTDDDMKLETNLNAVRSVSRIATEFGLPMTIDWQDGYGDRLEEGIESLIGLGVVGINLEDCDKDTQKMMPVDVAAERIKRVLAVAKKNGVEGFVINARTDTLIWGGPVSDAISRGKSYLAAGAANVFVWGGSSRGGLNRDEVVELTRAFDGKLNVAFKTGPGNLSVKDLSEIGVARISLGPTLQFMAMKTYGEEAEKILNSR